MRGSRAGSADRAAAVRCAPESKPAQEARKAASATRRAPHRSASSSAALNSPPGSMPTALSILQGQAGRHASRRAAQESTGDSEPLAAGELQAAGSTQRCAELLPAGRNSPVHHGQRQLDQLLAQAAAGGHQAAQHLLRGRGGGGRSKGRGWRARPAPTAQLQLPPARQASRPTHASKASGLGERPPSTHLEEFLVARGAAAQAGRSPRAQLEHHGLRLHHANHLPHLLRRRLAHVGGADEEDLKQSSREWGGGGGGGAACPLRPDNVGVSGSRSAAGWRTAFHKQAVQAAPRLASAPLCRLRISVVV